MRIGVITFPGTLDDGDAARAVRLAGGTAVALWHADHDLRGVDAVIVPGGFSYGDYLRAGAIASIAPIMTEVVAAAGRGLPVLGICNGFQILCEAGLLPGALVRNAGLHFVCRDQRLKVEAETAWTADIMGREIVVPVKNAEGRYVADAATLAGLEDTGRVVFRYTGGNPNGSLNDIAGVASADGRVVGLMPHPEHAVDRLTGPTTDGLALFTSVLRVAAGVMVGRGEEREPVRRLLLVEDDPGDAFLVGELIAEVDPELAVTVAGSMPEALPHLAESDCVLLDLNLPGYAGLDGLHTLLGADPLAAVCVLTGLDDEHLGTDAVAAGAQDYLVKGKVDGPLLIRAIRYAVERRRAETSLLRLREEQLVAAESSRLERGLLPSPLLAGSEVRHVAFYRAGRTRAVLGGDFFDAVRDADGTVHAIIGDVSGHGPDEAALGALLRVSWRALVLAGVAEERLLPELQRLLVSERHDSKLFTTACMITISADLAVVRVAGHPPPVALWSVTTLTPPVGLPLGVGMSDFWPAQTFALPPGWALLLYTDGLIEAREPDTGDFLWIDGLLDMLAVDRDTAHAELPARLVERAEAYNGGPLLDDVAILLLVGP